MKDEMLLLLIPVLERIFHSFYSSKKLKGKASNEVTCFLFEVLDKHGRDGSILFSNIDFENETIGVFNKLLNEYSDRFDFNMINSTLLKTATDVTNEMNKQKIEYSNLLDETNKQKIDYYNILEQISKQKNEYANLLEKMDNQNFHQSDLLKEMKKQKNENL